jgi:hypothetical protein
VGQPGPLIFVSKATRKLLILQWSQKPERLPNPATNLRERSGSAGASGLSSSGVARSAMNLSYRLE